MVEPAAAATWRPPKVELSTPSATATSQAAIPRRGHLAEGCHVAATATSLAVIPRRKAKTAPMAAGRGGPIIVTLDVLESFFHLPLPLASKRLGICRTALKKLCRKFGFSRWPRRSASAAEEGADADSDDQDEGSRNASARAPNFADVLCGG
ncbi:RWP-RK domain-containing protein, partial [Baffinella frigidus]